MVNCQCIIQFLSYFIKCPDHPYILQEEEYKEKICSILHQIAKKYYSQHIKNGMNVVIVKKNQTFILDVELVLIVNIVLKGCGDYIISCMCGNHFCYYCGGGPFNQSGEFFSHMIQNNHVNDPPDYRKYIKGEDVSDEELIFIKIFL